jgi:hypothetical protein
MISDIQMALTNLCAHPQAHIWSPYRDWTRQVIDAVGRVVSNHGYTWVTSGVGRGEWLCDGVAHVRSGDYLVSLALALECEWMGRTEIAYDFSKLLVIRVDLRVMVCAAVTRRGTQTHFRRMRDMITRFQGGSPGDRYLLAGWYGQQGSAGNFIFDVLP